MKISSKPEDYNGVFAPVLYKIEDADPIQITEVKILAPDESGLTTGIKRLFGYNSYTINIANYYHKYLNPQPSFSPEIIMNTPLGRHTVASVKIGEIESERTILTSGSVNGQECKLLSESPLRTSISPDEYDELSFFAPKRTLTVNITLKGKAPTKTIKTTTFTCGSGIYTYILNMRDLLIKAGDMVNYSLVHVDFIEGSTSIMHKEYDIIPHTTSSVRLCWLNKFGCIDYYTFSPVQTSVYAADKGKVYGRHGYEVSYSEAEMLSSVVSNYEPTKTIRWLAEILSSPKVWIAETEKLNNINDNSESPNCFTRVDILTKKINVCDDKPCALSLTFRAKKKITFQHG